MADLIMKLATQKCTIEAERVLADRQLAGSEAPTKPADDGSTQSAATGVGPMDADGNWQWAVLRTRDAVVDEERAMVIAGSGRASTMASGSDNDEQPLSRDWEQGRCHGNVSYGTEVQTKRAVGELRGVD